MKLTAIVCSEIKQPNGRIQLFPFGRFYPSDGRPEGKGGWYVDDTNGYALADKINQSTVKMMIDYEHQTLFIAQNGRGNPAAGWIAHAEYISGEGLFADVEWTDKASAQIKDKEYRYISPYFYTDDNGKVLDVINAALTNRPALHELHEAIATSQLYQHQQEDKPMLKLLQALFDLPDASEEVIKEKLTALSAEKTKAGIALSAVYSELATQQQKAVALSAQEPDPTKYVALSEMKAVQDELRQLKESVVTDKVEKMVEVALSEGTLLPAQKEWAVKLGKVNLQALSDYLSVAPKHNLGEKQAKGDPNGQKVALSAEDKCVAKMLGLTEEEFIKNKELGA
ncbi:phage protease [Gallibacterium sp. AGMB14963]|uniref:phage protease n=1 Tax=Gallibacterium faecale TaxID=3019086 RepID=UPI0022F1C9BF|nr:phage protease [Gallibacterium sp. AGMB14963]MDA3978481.1 phage protease [Gallibacterium sp. AGMB14963]